MSALYEMQYQGVTGTGHGAIYVGKGIIVGVDVTGARYHGTYTTGANGALNGSVTLTSAGGALVTGQAIPAGTQVPIILAVPSSFANGSYHQVMVGGQPVHVAFNKIGDIP